MDRAYFVMLAAFVISGGISYATGRLLWGVLIPTVSAGLFASFGAISHPVWFVGIFMMAALPYGAISTLGAALGVSLSPIAKSRSKNAPPQRFSLTTQSNRAFQALGRAATIGVRP